MKRIFAVLFFGVLILTACAPVTVESTIMPAPSETPTAVPPTLAPSPTPIPPTQTITPLPTIPTFTPTFEARTIVTVTPAAKAECPKEDLSLVPEFRIPIMPGCFDDDSCLFSGTEKEILEFVNKGGTLRGVISRLRSANTGDYRDYIYQDITGDKIPELTFIDFAASPKLHILYCQNRAFKTFNLDPQTDVVSVQFSKLEPVVDLNKNNIPEITWLIRGCSGSGCFLIFTLEWNGDGFSNLSPQVEMWGVDDLKIQDVDNNGTKEIILTGDYPGMGTYSMMVPWRLKTDIYSWNGQEYALASEYFVPPEFRFQAVQDADRYTLEQKYDKALSIYRATIFDDKLDWWSLEKRIYYVNDLDPWVIDNTPSPPPIPDPTEYPRLAAYAYYRIMLLELVQGKGSEAEITYSTLQQKFGSDSYGRPYVKMATAFWNAYQSSHKMYDGCAAAIEYAAEHPDILIPLGSNYHGWQSHIYVPADVCPFR